MNGGVIKYIGLIKGAMKYLSYILIIGRPLSRQQDRSSWTFTSAHVHLEWRAAEAPERLKASWGVHCAQVIRRLAGSYSQMDGRDEEERGGDGGGGGVPT